MNSNIKTKIKKNLPLYESLKKLPKEALKHVIEHLDDDSIDAICECVYNVVHTNLNMSKKKKLGKLITQHYNVSLNLSEILTTTTTTQPSAEYVDNIELK